MRFYEIILDLHFLSKIFICKSIYQFLSIPYDYFYQGAICLISQKLYSSMTIYIKELVSNS